MPVTENDIRHWLASSNTLFDIAVCDPSDLPETVCVIGPQDITRDIETVFTTQMGAVPLHKAQTLLQRVAGRAARILAQAQTRTLDIAPEGLRHAWFYAVFSELTSLVPVRHLARHYARTKRGQVIAIPLESFTLTALNGWQKNDAEVLYLAHELRRQNCLVFLYTTQEAPEPRLSFALSGRLLPKGYPRYLRSPDSTSVLSRTTLRRPDYVAAQCNTKSRRSPGIISRFLTFKQLRRRCAFTTELHAGPDLGGCRTYHVPQDAPTARDAFVTLMTPLTRQVADWFKSELHDKPVATAHVPDHANLEAGLLGAQVVRQGGSVHIWPHSANVVHHNAHTPKNVANVTVAARSTGTVWAKSFGPDKITVQADAILTENAPAPGYDPDAPLHVIVFAGAHLLRRVPLLDCVGHKATWSKTLDTLLSADCETLIKPKSVWETRDWITERAKPGADLRFTNVHANKLMHPNMIFLCVSATSTAILEGIARGVPGMVVRDIPVDETPAYCPDSIPYVASSQLADVMANLNSAQAWTDLLGRQRAWFERETSAR